VQRRSPATLPSRRSAAGEVIVHRDTFRAFWDQLLTDNRPYVTAGTLQDYTTHGRRRLLP